jgi:NAD(P)H-flavin reductase
MACDNCGCNKVEYEDIFMPKEAVVVKVSDATPAEKHFVLKWADGSPCEFQPGQFLEASLFGFGEIPLGYATSPTRPDTFELIIRAVGRVSTALCALKEGDTMLIRGPLGQGFPIDELKNNNVLIVAGGLGLAPTRSLIQYILDKKDEFKKFTLFYGARNPEEQLFVDDLKAWTASDKINFFETVDKANDVWTGKVGVCTAIFPEAAITADTKVIICGPPVMYKFVIMELDKIGVPHENIFVDLERRMKCGVGKCGHCQINDKLVCYDGPVFKYSEIENLEEAF